MSIRGVYSSTMDAALAQAVMGIKRQYGDTVDVASTAKGLAKFGENAAVATSFETVAQLQGATANETFVSTNIIDAAISSSASDTQTITVQGHTIDASGNLTSVTQNVTLTGQTSTTLTTPLARAERAFVAASGTFDSPQAAAVGNIMIYDNTDGDNASGVPTTAAATKLMISATETQSQKCALSTSSTEYLILSGFDSHIGGAGGNASFITVRVETRDIKNGGVWRPVGNDIVLVPAAASPPTSIPSPFLIIPPNHDIRARAKCDANSAAVTAGISGFYASVIS